LSKHLVSISDLTNDDIEKIFTIAKRLKNKTLAINKCDPRGLLTEKILACVFYEPSTRTSSSFIAAMTKLGGNIIPITQGVQFSSVSKGETFEDTIITLGQYADAIVLRHPEEGSALRASQISPVPIINAGDGIGEHPTQALLDLFTIVDHLKCYDGAQIALVGDLKYGRTVHSLVRLLANKNVNIVLVSPEQLKLPSHLLSLIPGASEVRNLADVVDTSDVIYMTRVQKERFPCELSYEKVKDCCILTKEMMDVVKKDAIVMHPLPRINEIDRRIDGDPRAVWFEQVKNGLWIRMAVLLKVLRNI
jgi:aspartate carbamoyltransferase catalytic subunit